MRVGIGLVAIALMLSSASSAGVPAPSTPQRVIARIDLSKPFHLPSGASFTATQGPEVPGILGDPAPGAITLCVRVSRSAPCTPDLDDGLKIDGKRDLFSDAHFLDRARLVSPRGPKALPIFHVQISSFHSGDGDQRRLAEIVAYRADARRFEIIFHEQFGRNNNEEVRYIDSGPLKGAMISAQPTDKPLGYWGYIVTVHRLTGAYRYRQVLRYRSSTRFADGNPLAVIDSEMPNILRRLGLWRPGQPLPLLEGRCPHPHLVKTELWCS